MKDMVERILEDEGVEQLQPTLDSEETTTAGEYNSVPMHCKNKGGQSHQIVSSNTPIAYLVCCGRQIGGLYPPLFLQCGIRYTL